MTELQPDGNGRTPLLEWLAAGAGLLLALAMLGFIGWEALRGEQTAPAITVEMLRVVETQAGYTVEVRAVNHGDATASDVTIEGELTQAGKVTETSQTTFTYVPGGSERRGGLFFSQDPRSGTLDLRPLGYVAP